MLTQSARGHPDRLRRAVAASSPGGILFGMAAPALPGLDTNWPTWLAPMAGQYRSAARRFTSSRRSQ